MGIDRHSQQVPRRVSSRADEIYVVDQTELRLQDFECEGCNLTLSTSEMKIYSW